MFYIYSYYLAWINLWENFKRRILAGPRKNGRPKLTSGKNKNRGSGKNRLWVLQQTVFTQKQKLQQNKSIYKKPA